MMERLSSSLGLQLMNQGPAKYNMAHQRKLMIILQREQQQITPSTSISPATFIIVLLMALRYPWNYQIFYIMNGINCCIS